MKRCLGQRLPSSTIASKTCLRLSRRSSLAPRKPAAPWLSLSPRSRAVSDRLSSRHWQGLPLAELVRRVLAPYATAGTVRIEGSEDVVLSAEAGQTVAMVLHELATNAAKFGALSAKDGCVAVRWDHLRNGGSQSRLRIQWEESGGPTVRPQERSGYGTSVIRHLVPYELGGTADIVRSPDGIHCTLEIPARWLESPGAGE
jgi:two-component sensor histidine kinase